MTDSGYIVYTPSSYTYLFIPYPVKKDKVGLDEKLNVKKSKKKCAITKEFGD